MTRSVPKRTSCVGRNHMPVRAGNATCPTNNKPQTFAIQYLFGSVPATQTSGQVTKLLTSTKT